MFVAGHLYVNVVRELRFERNESLSGKDVCIIGAGDIGSHLGKVLEALRANVRYVIRHLRRAGLLFRDTRH